MVYEAFSWGDDRPPNTPLHKTPIYDMHVKGFMKLNEDIPRSLVAPWWLVPSRLFASCKELGVTAVELLPIHGERA